MTSKKLSLEEREELAELTTLVAHPGFARMHGAIRARHLAKVREVIREKASDRDELAGEARGLLWAVEWVELRLAELAKREEAG